MQTVDGLGIVVDSSTDPRQKVVAENGLHAKIGGHTDILQLELTPFELEADIDAARDESCSADTTKRLVVNSVGDLIIADDLDQRRVVT